MHHEPVDYYDGIPFYLLKNFKREKLGFSTQEVTAHPEAGHTLVAAKGELGFIECKLDPDNEAHGSTKISPYNRDIDVEL
jgi:hypothetical protein